MVVVEERRAGRCLREDRMRSALNLRISVYVKSPLPRTYVLDHMTQSTIGPSVEPLSLLPLPAAQQQRRSQNAPGRDLPSPNLPTEAETSNHMCPTCSNCRS